MMSETLLFDMDDVIVEFSDGFWDVVRVKHPHVVIPEHDTSDSFNLTADVDGLTVEDARAIIDEAGFFATLKAVKGAVRVLKALLAAGYDVMICTAPAPRNPTCREDKIEWVRVNLGEEWVDRIIVTLDKTVVDSVVLFDDKPVITGKNSTPSWEHVLWTRYGNKHITGQRRVNGWDDVERFIAEELQLSK